MQPTLLKLHGRSTFRDMTYLTRQAFSRLPVCSGTHRLCVSGRSPSTTLPACCRVWRAPCGIGAWETEPRTRNSAPAHWDVENEYHVQGMLGMILAPYLPDLDDEEWLKSLGQHHPRADFAIPSLNLIIEVKFLRQGTTSAPSKLIQGSGCRCQHLSAGRQQLPEHHRFRLGRCREHGATPGAPRRADPHYGRA